MRQALVISLLWVVILMGGVASAQREDALHHPAVRELLLMMKGGVGYDVMVERVRRMEDVPALDPTAIEALRRQDVPEKVLVEFARRKQAVTPCAIPEREPDVREVLDHPAIRDILRAVDSDESRDAIVARVRRLSAVPVLNARALDRLTSKGVPDRALVELVRKQEIRTGCDAARAALLAAADDAARKEHEATTRRNAEAELEQAEAARRKEAEIERKQAEAAAREETEAKRKETEAAKRKDTEAKRNEAIAAKQKDTELKQAEATRRKEAKIERKQAEAAAREETEARRKETEAAKRKDTEAKRNEAIAAKQKDTELEQAEAARRKEAEIERKQAEAAAREETEAKRKETEAAKRKDTEAKRNEAIAAKQKDTELKRAEATRHKEAETERKQAEAAAREETEARRKEAVAPEKRADAPAEPTGMGSIVVIARSSLPVAYLELFVDGDSVFRKGKIQEGKTKPGWMLPPPPLLDIRRGEVVYESQQPAGTHEVKAAFAMSWIVQTEWDDVAEAYGQRYETTNVGPIDSNGKLPICEVREGRTCLVLARLVKLGKSCAVEYEVKTRK